MQTDRVGEIREGPPGSTLERGMHAEKASGTWEAPTGSTAETQPRNDLAQGIRLLSHERGITFGPFRN